MTSRLEEVEETMRLWIKGRKRDTIGSIVAVIIWIVLLGSTFH